jgi:NTP pyrophosphatase (non-canonical NTP hydrolase)
MTFEQYAQDAQSTAEHTGLNYPSVALGGEIGEYLNEYKKWLRTQPGVAGEVPYGIHREKMLIELGDILWYLNRVVVELDSSLEDVAKMNITKLTERYKGV